VTGAVLLNVRARAESGIRIAALPVHAIVLGDAGQRWRVRDDGGLDPVIQGGRPHGGIAADPTATRRP
jgi:hypothetical protein